MFEQISNVRKVLPSLKSFRNMKPLARRELRQGFLFIGLWIVGFLAFTFLPIIASFLFSFMDLKITSGILSKPHFVGLENYKFLFKDGQVWTSPGALWVTFRFGLIALPIGILTPLGLALLMNNKNLKGQMLFRSLFYMPYIVPFVAAVFLWGGMLNPETGWINRALLSLGVAKANLPGWTNSTDPFTGVYPAYVIMGIWGVGNAMLIMLAGLQAVPTELYDAAKVDGANYWQTFRNITFPMISPVIFYNVTLGIVELFQYFLIPLVVDQGNGRPGGATMFYNLYLYRTFFVFQNMSYGATLAWFLFLIILLVTIILFATAKYWVYYAGDGRYEG